MKRVKKFESGQALIELIVFLPLMLTLYSVIAGFANSINGSINQQKIARSYFYYRVQNNSTIPGTKSGDFQNWHQFGMFYIGWKEKFESGDQPVMPCYKISIPFKEDTSDTCEQSYSNNNTLWIRVGTVYGICGGTYITLNNQVYPVPDIQGMSFSTVADQSSCTISQ